MVKGARGRAPVASSALAGRSEHTQRNTGKQTLLGGLPSIIESFERSSARLARAIVSVSHPPKLTWRNRDTLRQFVIPRSWRGQENGVFAAAPCD